MKKNKVLETALRNYGYRRMAKRGDTIIFGKPVGLCILRADCCPKKNSIWLAALVKGDKRNGTRRNLVWNSCDMGFIEQEPKAMYQSVVNAIARLEADFFEDGDVTQVSYCDVRFDFEENPLLILDEMFEVPSGPCPHR